MQKAIEANNERQSEEERGERAERKRERVGGEGERGSRLKQ